MLLVAYYNWTKVRVWVLSASRYYTYASLSITLPKPLGPTPNMVSLIDYAELK
jgi:hypothetical protein